MISQKLQSEFFGTDHAQEAAKRLKVSLDRMDRAMAMGTAILSLKQSGGFQEFLKATEDLKVHLLQSMENFHGADSELRVLQGRAQGLTQVIGLMRSTESSLKALAERRKTVQDSLDDIERSNGQRPGVEHG